MITCDLCGATGGYLCIDTKVVLICSPCEHDLRDDMIVADMQLCDDCGDGLEAIILSAIKAAKRKPPPSDAPKKPE